MKITIGAGAVAAGLMAATGASAESLSVAYTVAPTAVPTMTEWAMIGLFVALAAAAVLAIRRQGLHRNVALGFAAVLAAGAVLAPQSSQAANLSLTLDGISPNLVGLPLNAANHTVTITNGTQGAVTITEFSVVGGNRFFLAPFGFTCTFGQVLAPGASCTVGVFGNEPV